MASLNDLFQLDPTSGTNNSNSNFAGAGIEEGGSPAALNNALRALGSMAARAICYQGDAISSSVSTNLVTASSGLAVAITGANAVTSFGVVPGEFPDAAVLRIVEFSSSASLSHGGSLFLTGGASRRTQPGDIGIYLHQGSSDRWKEIAFSRADGTLPMDSLSVTTLTGRSISTSAISTVTLNAASISATNQVFTSLNATSASASVVAGGIFKYGSTQLSEIYVQSKSVSSAASDSTSSNIPFDNSIPRNDEGANLFSLSITPRNASSILEIEALIHMSTGTGVNNQIALFLDNAVTAIASASFEGLSSDMLQVKLYHEHTASTTAEHVYALRYGGESGSVKINHGAGGNLGGTMRSWLRVKERLQ